MNKIDKANSIENAVNLHPDKTYWFQYKGRFIRISGDYVDAYTSWQDDSEHDPLGGIDLKTTTFRRDC